MKCALIGLGYWGKIVKRYIEASPQFVLSSIYDAKVMRENCLEEILRNEEIDCLFLCTPINTHFDLVKRALESNKHVFCEKPLCKSVCEVNVLAELALRNNKVVYTDYIYTNSPSLHYIKRKLPQLGKIFGIRTIIKQFGNFYTDDDALEVVGVHMLSAVAFILNRYSIEDYQVSEEISFMNDGNGKCLYGMERLMISDIPYVMEYSLMTQDKVRTIEIIGEKGMFTFSMCNEFTVEEIYYKQEDNKLVLKEKRNCGFDETNNLKYALESFYETIREMKTNNFKLSLLVSELLEKIKTKVKI